MKRAVLVMAYGSPRSLDHVEAYYTDIRRGRPPSRRQLDDLTERYRAIGGSPLYAITEAQTRGIQERLGIPAYIGQKHAAPTIADAIESMSTSGIESAVGIVLAPHYSRMSIGDYEARALKAAADAGWTGRLGIVRQWHLEAGYIEFLARAVRRALDSLPRQARTRAEIVFTAHSLPARIVEAGDPYLEQLRATGAAVAERGGLGSWRTGWQSAGQTEDPWLGPDVIDVMHSLATEGVPGVVVCACGFVADHLEVLYDLDIETRAVAEKLGIAFARTDMPNDDPAFLDMLAGVVERRFSSGE